jgi:hypothetical protein
MNQRRHKATMGRQETPALAESLLRHGDRVIKTTEIDEGDAHSSKIPEMPRIKRA